MVVVAEVDWQGDSPPVEMSELPEVGGDRRSASEGGNTGEVGCSDEDAAGLDPNNGRARERGWR